MYCSPAGQRERRGGRVADDKDIRPPLFLTTSPYIAHCMGACSAKGEWGLFSPSLSLYLLYLSSLSSLYTGTGVGTCGELANVLLACCACPWYPHTSRQQAPTHIT